MASARSWLCSLRRSSHMQLFAGKDHIFFGWVLFLAAMGLMYWVAERYSDVGMEQTPCLALAGRSDFCAWDCSSLHWVRWRERLALPATVSISQTSLPLIKDCVSMRGWHGRWSPSFVGADYTVAGQLPMRRLSSLCQCCAVRRTTPRQGSGRRVQSCHPAEMVERHDAPATASHK